MDKSKIDYFLTLYEYQYTPIDFFMILIQNRVILPLFETKEYLKWKQKIQYKMSRLIDKTALHHSIIKHRFYNPIGINDQSLFYRFFNPYYLKYKKMYMHIEPYIPEYGSKYLLAELQNVFEIKKE